MSPKLSAVLAAALLFGADATPLQAQTPDIRSINPADPRNAPLTLKQRYPGYCRHISGNRRLDPRRGRRTGGFEGKCPGLS